MKFTSEAGPIQTKRVGEAYRRLLNHGRSWVEKYDSGHECTLSSPLSPPSEVVQQVAKAIGDAVGWKITTENHKAVIASFDKAVETIPLPIVDKRTTPEERAAREKQAQENQAKDDERRARIAALVDKYRAKYTWAVDGSKLSPHAHAAANVREELKRHFPGHRFSVRSESYSGGDSIRVNWTMGPTEDEVRQYTDKYKEGHFDGMDDSYKHTDDEDLRAIHKVLGSIRHLFTERDPSQQAVDVVAAHVSEAMGLKSLPPRDQWYRTTTDAGNTSLEYLVNSAIRSTSFPPGAVVTGITENPANSAIDRYVCTFDAPAAPQPKEGWKEQYDRMQREKPDDLILLRMGDFYEAYGDNAAILRDELMLTITLREGERMAGLPHHVLESHLSILQAAGYSVTVGVHDTTAAPKNCRVEKHHHTKKDFDMWVVVLTAKVERVVFESMRDRCKQAGGWYSRQWGKTPGGFAFDNEADANTFASTL